jgi:hypothetical protein
MGEYFCDTCKFYGDDVTFEVWLLSYVICSLYHSCLLMHITSFTETERVVPLHRLCHMQVSTKETFTGI